MNPPETLVQAIFKTRGPLDPVNDNAIYAPRHELDQLLRAALATTVDAYLAILSSRQTGKTTLLYQMRHHLRPQGYGVALIDLSVIRDQPEAQLYRFVAGGLRSDLESSMPRTSDRKDTTALPTNPLEFRQFVLSLGSQVRTQRIIVLLDEVEAVPGNLSDAFFGTIRNIFSSRRKEDEAAFAKYLFVLSGAKELHRLTTGPNSPLNIADRIYLKDLYVSGVQLLVANFQRAGIYAPAGTAHWIYDQTGGHPYLTQKICSTIEQWHPPSITPDLVEQAADDILRSDDHLEKMVSHIENEPMMRDRLREIAIGKSVSFSRLVPTIARLELVGAIRDDGNCAIRNEIYHKAIQAYLNLAQSDLPRRALPWGRILIATVAWLVLVLNLPLLFNYTNEVLLAPRLVSVEYAPPGLGAHTTIRYSPVLRANDANPASLTVDADLVDLPLVVLARAETPDVSINNARRRFDPPSRVERYEIFLNQNSVPYDPLHPFTPHQSVNLIFESAAGAKPSQTFSADFRVDQFSAVAASFAASIASVIAAFASLWANVERIQKAAAFIGNLGKPKEEKE